MTTLPGALACVCAAFAAIGFLAIAYDWHRKACILDHLTDELRLTDETRRQGEERVLRLIARIQVAQDEQIRRGFKCLSEYEVAELLMRKPIQPSDFVVTDRGRPLHFEDAS